MMMFRKVTFRLLVMFAQKTIPYADRSPSHQLNGLETSH